MSAQDPAMIDDSARRLDRLRDHTDAVVVVGMGYVGLPLALCLARRFRVIGYDPVDACPGGSIADAGITYTDALADIAAAAIYIICVPTPIDAARRPDLRALLAASRSIGSVLVSGAIVVYESTVYPGCTEEACLPVLEAVSGLRCGRDFAIGYSPERVNPGDTLHTIDRIAKVVSASDPQTLAILAGLYGAVITAGIHQAPSIQVAEASKVIENTQRDLNIALANELSMIFRRLGIDTRDVLDAAGTKWNFVKYTPGLVGGHCIGVDPYYLTDRAERLGHHPEVILAGRRINDGMGAYVAGECIRLMARAGQIIKGARVLILGFTFKENCPDVRNTKVIDIHRHLVDHGCEVVIHDPLASPQEVHEEYGVDMDPAACDGHGYAAIILAVAHRAYAALDPVRLRHLAPSGIVLDVKCVLDRSACEQQGLTLWRL
jgi:UDP-N-acetyl-D-galactosamine dehydrogenase